MCTHIKSSERSVHSKTVVKVELSPVHQRIVDTTEVLCAQINLCRLLLIFHSPIMLLQSHPFYNVGHDRKSFGQGSIVIVDDNV